MADRLKKYWYRGQIGLVAALGAVLQPALTCPPSQPELNRVMSWSVGVPTPPLPKPLNLAMARKQTTLMTMNRPGAAIARGMTTMTTTTTSIPEVRLQGSMLRR